MINTTSSISEIPQFEHTDFKEEEIVQRLKGDIEFSEIDFDFPSVPFAINEVKTKQKDKIIIRRKEHGTSTKSLF